MSNDLFKNKYRIPSARADWHRYNIGWYYITICTDKRVHYFGEITNKQMHLSQIGKFTDSFLNELHLIYNDAAVLSYVVMPNHIHMIIAVEKTSPHKSDKKINEDVNEEMQYIANQCGRMSHIISRFKSFITKYAKDNDIPFKWQTRFYDRIIRDYADYIVIEHYINNNISKWKDDDF
jgi:REP element-mobilizing transposase RayT